MGTRKLTSNIREYILEQKPTIKNYKKTFDLDIFKELIAPWEITRDILDEFIETIINLKTIKNKDFDSYADYYLGTVMIVFENSVEKNNFEYFKKIFKNFVLIQENILSYGPDKRSIIDKGDDKTSITGNIEDSLRNSIFYLIKNFNDEEIFEIEKIIDENIDCFLNFNFYDRISRMNFSPLYLNRDLQENFPFSIEFIQKYFKYFKITLITKNNIAKSNMEIQKIMFSDILKSNLEERLKYYTFGDVKHDFTISEELCCEMMLKYNL